MKSVRQCLLSIFLLSVVFSTYADESAQSGTGQYIKRFVTDWSARHLPEGVSLYATDWFRWSEWRYFDPAAPGGDPDYGLFSNRLRFGLLLEQKTWSAEASLQYVKQFSLPDDAAGTPGGVLGPGAAYFVHNGSKSPDSLYIKYLNVTLHNLAQTGLDVTIGRFNYGSGTETLTGNGKIDWLKKTRLDARLIGGFEWSIYQRSFDGIRAGWTHDNGHLSFAAFRPTQGGFEASANKRIDNLDVVATTYTVRPGLIIPDAEIQFFNYYLNDERRVAERVDNSGRGSSGRQDLAFHTTGGHLVATRKFGPGSADFLLWGAYQHGDWFEQYHKAAAVAIEAGYQFTSAPWRPWLRAGVFRSTGDDDPADRDHETFYQILPTVRKYSFTTTNNLMNNRDYHIQLLLSPVKKLSVRTDLHFLELDESADLWYGGAGATQASGNIQGFSGRPSGNHDYLGTSLEFTANYQLSDNINLHAFYGHVFGGKVIKNNFADDDDLDFLFLETTILL